MSDQHSDGGGGGGGGGGKGKTRRGKRGRGQRGGGGKGNPPKAPQQRHDSHDDDLRAESRHFQEVLASFRGYDYFMLSEVARRERHAARMPAALAARLPEGAMATKVQRLKDATATNQAFLNGVLEAESGFGPAAHPGTAAEGAQSTPSNYSKVLSTLHQCVREWGAEGAAERAATFGPILEELQRLLPVRAGGALGNNMDQQRVNVPGCGLGRLVIEIVGKGYAAQGNEFSYHMLMMSSYLMNHVSRPEQLTLHPWIDASCNQLSAELMLRAVPIPDVAPSSFLSGPAGSEGEGRPPRCPDLSMCAGEFLEVYADDVACWDAVVTCFFLDTAPNAMEYVEAIERMLVPGGVWINFGPLMYHWCSSAANERDDRFHRSMEFSYDEVRHLVRSFGFTFTREERREVNYTANPHSMMKTAYTCAFFSAVKPGGTTDTTPFRAPGAVDIIPPPAPAAGAGGAGAAEE